MFAKSSIAAIGQFAGIILHDHAFIQPYKALAGNPQELGTLVRDSLVDQNFVVRPEWHGVVERWRHKIFGGNQGDVMYRLLIRLAVYKLLLK